MKKGIVIFLAEPNGTDWKVQLFESVEEANSLLVNGGTLYPAIGDLEKDAAAHPHCFDGQIQPLYEKAIELVNAPEEPKA